ncbi:hypothetical protein PR202_gb12180 [Eleusine coracana subsp. coracana]|uniref:Protein kinase domain-containing protein n=1 Tax=Eleusine coracana subsp. coracana TaxID=191504 RepID=A0AAV5EPU0_ELECO|nr:hypothetical protein PR202_gb12180 [Eleusine coracana subsp. coracana]
MAVGRLLIPRRNHDQHKLADSATNLDYSKLPKVSATQLRSREIFWSGKQTIWDKTPEVYLEVIGSVGSFVILVAIILAVRRCCRYREIREDWELEFGPHRFSYKDLFHATDGFKDKLLLGAGGFGKVYKGVLPSSKLEVAVKVMSHDSKQGMKEFVAEVVSMGRLRHRNLVQLLGYCRRKGELLLVYEYMSNGSLDKHLYDLEKPSLNWAHRFEIIKCVASGLLYLHEEWEQVVIHRDVKASNVLLDEEMNGQLGDFGLARLHDHGVEAHTTCVAGTRGYISPELARLGKATKATDVFAFGFTGANLILDGVASITPNGLLELTNGPARLKGHAFHPTPFHFSKNNRTLQSFSITFIFAIYCIHTDICGHGIALVISARNNFSDAMPSQYMGLINSYNNGNASNHFFAVELDTNDNDEFKDIDNNHVGIDINGLDSVNSRSAGYYDDNNDAVDIRLQGAYNVNEAKLMLKLGLLCSHPFTNRRPTMREVMHYLNGNC